MFDLLSIFLGAAFAYLALIKTSVWRAAIRSG